MITCGVDVGGTKILAVRLDDAGEPVGAPRRVPTPLGSEAITDAIADLVEAARPFDAVGVGIPGLVDHTGRLRVGPNLPGVVEFSFAEVLTGRLGVPVRVDNDANCAAWAEHERGAARGVDDALLITLGTGIGGGVIAGGRLQRGAHGFAGEPGHMVIDPDGPPCPCGQRGCWERYASGSGLGRLGRDAAQAGRAPGLVAAAGGDAEDVRGEHVTRTAAGGDPDAVAVLGQYAWWVALGIANLVNLLDPAIVVVGGGLVEVGDLLFDPLRKSFHELVVAGAHRPPVPIVPAELGEDAGAIGAGLLARAQAPG